MTAGDRFKNWIEGLSKAWGDRLASWGVGLLARGATKTLEDMEPGAIESFRDIITKVRNNPLTPPEMVKFYDKALVPGNWFTELIAGLTIAIGAIPALLSAGVPLGNLIQYDQDKFLKSFRLDPGQVITAWRRDPAAYQKYFDDLLCQGWSQERIDTLKEITEIIPGVQDLVRMSVREAFSPEIAEKFGQYQDPPTLVYPWAEKLGLSKEWVDRYWAAHWELPSSGQGFELLHRGIITEDELKLLLRALDIMPYWRDKLINISWAVPTRVDVRRFWDMRTIDEARLREVYTAIGYHGKDLEDYVLWTKIYVDFPDLLARYKNGWITLDQVKSELVAMGMKPERADTMIEEKIKKAAPERASADKALSLTDIYKGVKQGRITQAEAVELIMDLGYDQYEAEFKLAVNIPSDQVDEAVEERQLTKAEILSGLKAEVISRDEARQKLLDIRYSVANTDLLLKIFDSQVKPPEEAKLKEASKADIVLGVKKGLITQEEGYLMLLDLGFSPDASLFILTVQTEETPFSPINFAEFKELTQKYRLASGLEGKPMNEEIRAAAQAVILLTSERDSIQRSIVEEKRGLVGEEILPAEATARLKKLQTSLRKAEAALSAAKTGYDRLVAEFKHGG